MMCHKSDKDSIEKCIEILKKGGIVILPTDTVYGFSGAVCGELNTDSKIRKIKGREETKPFIQLIGKPEDIKKYSDDIIPDSLLKLWPGPLTIICKNKNSENTTAYRCPDDKWLCSIITGLGCPVYSTSANRSGTPILETVCELEKEFSEEVDLIVSDGDRKGGKASTLVKIENGKIVVLRQGELKVE